MFNRSILNEFRAWKDSATRKPLVLRGARQVGKTTAVEIFSKEYGQFIHLNLEKPEEAALFSRGLSAPDLFQAILLRKNLPRIDGGTLLFLDEIQNSPEAVRMLRYFHEDLPDLHIIAAGSLLEILLAQEAIGMPVGRVQYLFLYPLTFREYLEALGETQALKALSNIPVSSVAVPQLFELFHRFSLVGGMPEIVARYAANRDVVSLKPIYESLSQSGDRPLSRRGAAPGRRTDPICRFRQIELPLPGSRRSVEDSRTGDAHPSFVSHDIDGNSDAARL
jgi:predicted AAA+ superfamily ATPase